MLKTALIPILSLAALTLSGPLAADTPNPEGQATAPEAQGASPPPPPAQVQTTPPPQTDTGPAAQAEATPPAEAHAAPAPQAQAEPIPTQPSAPKAGGAPSPFVHQADALLKQMQAMQEYRVQQHETMRKQAEEQLEYLKSHQDELFKDAVDRQAKLAEYYENKRKQAEEERAKLEKHREQLLKEALEQQTTLAERQEKLRKEAADKLAELQAEREHLSALSGEEIQAAIAKWRKQMHGPMGQGEQMTNQASPWPQQPGFGGPMRFGGPQFGPEAGLPGAQGFAPGAMPGHRQGPFFGPGSQFPPQTPLGQGPTVQGGPAANMPGAPGQGPGFRSPQGPGAAPGFGPQGGPGVGTGRGYPGPGMGQRFRGPESRPGTMMERPYKQRGWGGPPQGMQPYQGSGMPGPLFHNPGQGFGPGFGAQREETRDTAFERRVRSRQAHENHRVAAQRRHEDAWARHEQRWRERNRQMERRHAWAPEGWLTRDATASPDNTSDTPANSAFEPDRYRDTTRWLHHRDSSRRPMRSWRT